MGVPDAEAAIESLNRVRSWLPAILAPSVNSPFWLGLLDYGLDEDLVDVVGERSVPASQMLDTMLAIISPALEEHEWKLSGF